MHVRQERAEALLGGGGAHEGQRPLAHAVIGASKGDNALAAAGNLDQLDGRVDGIGPGGSAELDSSLVAQVRAASAPGRRW